MFQAFGKLAVSSYKQARRIAIFVVGVTVVLIGCALIVLPGPAFVVIPVGIGILAIEFAWARRLLRRAKRMFEESTQGWGK